MGRDYVPNVIFSCARQAFEIPGFSEGAPGDILNPMANPRRFGGLRAAPVLLLLLFLALLSTRPAPAAADDAALVAALRAGGHVLYFRHSATDWAQNDQVRQAGDWQSCDGARMRQLSDAGRMTAQLIGLAIRTLAIPVGEVLSSEYCRAAETARLMGLGDVRTTTEIMNLRAQEYVGGHDAAVKNARALLARPPAPAANRIMVGHGNLMRAATGQYTDEAGAVVVRPDPGSDLGFAFVALVTPQDWLRLAEAFGGGK
jgi:phosphohistidine phosphatase SixA